MNKKHWLLVSGVAAGLTWIAVAQAGLKSSYPLVINVAARTAKGSVASVRNSSDNTAYLGCGYTLGGGVAPFLRCFARNSEGTTVACTRDLYVPSGVPGQSTTIAPFELAYMNAILAISTDSYIEFGWDAAGKCTSFSVENGSNLAVKVP